jgi:hypothetical protein
VSAGGSVGDDFVPTATCSDAATVFPTTTGFVPNDSVITSYRITTSPDDVSGTRTFKVGRNVYRGDFDVVYSGDPVAVTAGQVVTQDVRIPLSGIGAYYGGYHIGFSYNAGSTCAKIADPSTSAARVFAGDAPVGSRVFLESSYETGRRYPVSATFEPDLDRDGYGDYSQDRCPTDQATQDACKVDTVAPQTAITAVRTTKVNPAKPGKRAKVTVAFSSTEPSVFSCSVDGAAFSSCFSPLVARLKKGRHVVTVVAADGAANADPSPATTRVLVKLARRAGGR